MDMPSSRPVERGDLSLALAGAELIDLLRGAAVRLDGDRLVPEPAPPMDDRLLEEAASSFTGADESVNDWLWTRGRGLAAAYLAAFEAEGQLTAQRTRRWGLLRTSRKVLVDSLARQRAANRWAADEPVLAALAAVVGIRDRRAGDYPDVADENASTVLTAVTAAVGELADERQRRDRKLDDAAVTNYRRGY